MTWSRAVAVGLLAGGLLPSTCSSNAPRSASASCPTPPGRYSQDQLLNVRRQVEALTAGNISGVGTGANAVDVGLLPGRERLAADREPRQAGNTDHGRQVHRAIAGTGVMLSLRNGEERTIRVLVGTSRCDGHLGSAVPPGTYGVRVGIGPNEGPPAFLAPEVSLTINAP